MSKTIRFSLLALLILAGSCFPEQIKYADLQMIIPAPSKLVMASGNYVLRPGTDIVSHPGLLNEAEWLRDFLGHGTRVIEKRKGSCIQLGLDAALSDTLGEEGYILTIDKMGISINAATNAGVFYGIQSLRQILPAACEEKGLFRKFRIQHCSISDKPRFPWRGMLLDCCRHFMEKDFVKRYIDLLAMHKMNRLHWHLTEDQGWRIEIKKYPMLTETGAWRTEKDGSRYGGYYTQDEIREIVAYAASRHVMVIPEIELPGHSQAALASYPHLSCRGEKLEVANTWGVFRDIYCAGNDSVLIFLKGVIDEVVQLFPAPYIHIGGDEAPKYEWERCDKCQDRIRNESLPDEDALQSWFIKQMQTYLASKDRMMIGWDEIIEGGLAPSAIVQSWRSMEGAAFAAKAGHNAIVSPTSHAYFDYAIGTIDMEKVYSFDPLPRGLSPGEEARILGGECNMWTERAPQEKVDGKVFPRILAMSEVLWSPRKEEFEAFRSRVQNHYTRLEKLGVDYGPETEWVSFTTEIPEQGSLMVTVSPGQQGLELSYQQIELPGMDTVKSGISIGTDVEFMLSTDAMIMVQPLFKGHLIQDNFQRSFSIHKALGTVPSYSFPYSNNYPASGESGLVDGVKGTEAFRDGNWQGFEGDDLDVVIDLGKEVPISELYCGFLQSNPSWIFMPLSLGFELSSESGQLLAAHEFVPGTSPAFIRDTIETLGGSVPQITARYIRVLARNRKEVPAWHPGAGGKSWVFADEIIIK